MKNRGTYYKRKKIAKEKDTCWSNTKNDTKQKNRGMWLPT
jgi:hypothetical protein